MEMKIEIKEWGFDYKGGRGRREKGGKKMKEIRSELRSGWMDGMM